MKNQQLLFNNLVVIYLHPTGKDKQSHLVFFNMQTNLIWHCKTGYPTANIFTSQTMDNSKLAILINWTSPFLI